jgi:hypothetical protein
MYLPCPTGGQAEYGADSDYLDDSWVPRVWNPMFGFFSFAHNLAPFMMDAAPWEWDYAPGYTPEAKAKRNPTPSPASPRETSSPSKDKPAAEAKPAGPAESIMATDKA